MTDPTTRIDSLRALLEKNPSDSRILFALALEYEKQGRWLDAVTDLQRYLAVAEDQGNAWGRLGHALRQLGRDEEARDAYRRGIDAARRHGHPSMAAEFEQVLEDPDA